MNFKNVLNKKERNKEKKKEIKIWNDYLDKLLKTIHRR